MKLVHKSEITFEQVYQICLDNCRGWEDDDGRPKTVTREEVRASFEGNLGGILVADEYGTVAEIEKISEDRFKVFASSSRRG